MMNLMIKICSLPLIASLIPCMALTAQSPWELKKDKDSIFIYSRSSQDSKFNEMKVVFGLRGNFAQLRSILEDIPHYHEWAYATKTSTIIEKRSANEVVYYSEVAAPWPFSNRDFYSNTRIWLDSAGEQMRVSSHCVSENYPQKTNLVRMRLLRAEWKVSMLSPLQLQVEYILVWNPGGSIPAWLANLFSTTGPYQTFTQLRKKMAGLNP